MGWFLGILSTYYGVNLSLQFHFVPPTGDQRVLSPLVHNKQIYLPAPSSLTELSGLEVKQNTGSLSGFGESSIHTPTKSKSRQSSHSISSHASGNSEKVLLLVSSPHCNWMSYWKVMTCKMCCFWLSAAVLATVPFRY